MNEAPANQVIPESGREYRFKVELFGGTASFWNELSDGTPELVMFFDGTEKALERRFNHEIVQGEKWYFTFTGLAKAFYR
jgi:hypothetical protein